MDNEVITVDEQKPVAQPQLTPMAMIAQAVAQGADVAKLSALLDLQERYEKTEARKAFVAALTEFKNNPPEIFKSKTVDFSTQKGRTHYKHAGLADVSSIIGAALSKVGISHRWETEQLDGGIIRVTAILTHALGHSERTPLQAKPDESGNKNSIQAVGSTVTYLQRYTLLSATGMAVSDGTDDDGRQGKKMSDLDLAGWIAQINDVANEKDAAELWASIAKTTTQLGDVEAHEQLRAAMAAKRKALKAKPAKVEDEGL